MKEITLKTKKIPDIGLEAENISPDVFAGKTLEEIRNLDVYEGNRIEKLGKYFEVKGTSTENPEDLKIIVEGDAGKIKHIGQEISAGEILVKGNVGMHLGSRMRGGRITVEGNASSWVGMEMSGGEITVKGSAENYVGAAYRGRCEGMKGGEITIKGNVGSNTGGCMTGGRITVEGNADQFTGVRMQGGLIHVKGKTASRAGAEMLKGTIILNGGVEEMLPSFKKKSEVDEIKAEEKKIKGRYTEYQGDISEGEEGRIYVSTGN